MNPPFCTRKTASYDFKSFLGFRNFWLKDNAGEYLVKVFAGSENVKGYDLQVENLSDNFTDEFLDKVREVIKHGFKG